MKLTKKNITLAIGTPAALLVLVEAMVRAEERFGDLTWKVPALIVLLALLGWAAVEKWGDK